MRHTYFCTISTLIAGVYILASAALIYGPASAEPVRPLLLEGKKTIYQRVVSHPGAKLFSGPEAQARVIDDKVKTFTAFYVYGRKDNRIRVGVSDNRIDGWLDADKTTFWKQAITMVFTNRMGRMPVLFFKDHEALETTCVDENLGEKIRGYVKISSGKDPVPAGFPVVAVEPPDTAVSEKNFYLLPVLNVDNSFGDRTKLLEVASIDPGIGGVDEGGKSSPTSGGAELRSGFVFVIDTTISMKPYIDQTLKQVRAIYDELEKNPNGDKIAFAVVAFRSSVQRSPGLQYTAKVVCDFKNVRQRRELEQALSQVEEATVSSHAFDEDSFAGVKEAVDRLDWSNYGSRIMLLVTDAGPLREGDPSSVTKMSPAVLADYIKTNRIYVTVVHLKTPAGARNHASAEKAYRELSRQADNQSSYIAVDASTSAKGAAAFDAVGRRLAKGYNDLVTATAEGKLLSAPAPSSKKAGLSPEEEARRIAESTGYAIQLQFLGTREGVRAPSVVKAWVADADLERLAREPQGQPVIAVQPALLVTKTQLSQLRKQLKAVFENAQQSFLKDDAKNFFQSILSAAAQMTRDPNAFTGSPGKNLAETGVMGEFLEGLPYKSAIMNLTEEEWYQKSTGEQKSILNHLEARIRLYEEYDRDSTNWEGFGSPNRDEWVYRIPLDMLP
ncbi:MAG: VWA domain-containing protein [Desulfovibrio sp.]|jgi:serine/threonine-protein kinase PpkA|nr:VWA domain-containing protein [Desulfovibrio sp.]